MQVIVLAKRDGTSVVRILREDGLILWSHLSVTTMTVWARSFFLLIFCSASFDKSRAQNVRSLLASNDYQLSLQWQRQMTMSLQKQRNRRRRAYEKRKFEGARRRAEEDSRIQGTRRCRNLLMSIDETSASPYDQRDEKTHFLAAIYVWKNERARWNSGNCRIATLQFADEGAPRSTRNSADIPRSRRIIPGVLELAESTYIGFRSSLELGTEQHWLGT